MTFGDFMDKFKGQAKQAADNMNLTDKLSGFKIAGKIAALKMEKTTQRTERDRLLKDIGTKTYGIYRKSKKLEQEVLMEEIENELDHLERIDDRIIEIDAEVKELQAEILKTEGKASGVVAATVDEDEDDDEAEDDVDEDEEEDDEDEDEDDDRQKRRSKR